MYSGVVDSQALKGHLDMLLLAAIRAEPMHGYGILERLRVLSDGTFDLPEGTIYPALYRLERAGLLSSRSRVHGGRNRRVYQLTPAGAAALVGKREQWGQFSDGVTRVLEGAL
jgi:PadR family transcriptional regulator, regulatory protein PadR